MECEHLRKQLAEAHRVAMNQASLPPPPPPATAQPPPPQPPQPAPVPQGSYITAAGDIYGWD